MVKAVQLELIEYSCFCIALVRGTLLPVKSGGRPNFISILNKAFCSRIIVLAHLLSCFLNCQLRVRTEFDELWICVLASTIFQGWEGGPTWDVELFMLNAFNLKFQWGLGPACRSMYIFDSLFM